MLGEVKMVKYEREGEKMIQRMNSFWDCVSLKLGPRWESQNWVTVYEELSVEESQCKQEYSMGTMMAAG